MRLEPRSKPHTTRRQLASRRKLQTHRKRSLRIAIVVGALLALAGLVFGGSVAVSTGAATREEVSSTSALAESTGLESEQLAVYDEIAQVHTNEAATIVLGEAQRLLAATEKKKVDASGLAAVTSSLAGYEKLPLEKTESLTAQARSEIAIVTTAAAAADRAAAKAAAKAAADATVAKAKADAAAAKKVAEQAVVAKATAVKEAAAQAAAQAAVAKKAAEAAAANAAAAAQAEARAKADRAASLAGSNSPAGARATASGLASSRYGWGSKEFSCLSQLWQKESGWNYQAYNASSGATGIPQALPGSKMASAGSDWATNAATQIAWGLDYIKGRYGSPCAAWEHSRAKNWY